MKRVYKPRKDKVIITLDISEWHKLENYLVLTIFNCKHKHLKKFATDLLETPLTKN